MPIKMPTIDLSKINVDLSSKTTQQGLLACISGFFTMVGGIIGILSAAHPGLVGYAIASFICTWIVTTIKARIGTKQGDADQTWAHVPGELQPQMVPAHAEPDDPANIPVPKEAPVDANATFHNPTINQQ